MTDTSTVAGGRPPSTSTTYNPIAGASFPPGTPVRQDLHHDDTVLPGRADSIDTTILTGIAVGAGVEGWGSRSNNRVHVQYIGPLTLPIQQWSEITDNPRGLIRGVPYFLSATDDGKLTIDPPTDNGTFVAPVGVALSATTLFILLSFPSVRIIFGKGSSAPTASASKPNGSTE